MTGRGSSRRRREDRAGAARDGVAAPALSLRPRRRVVVPEWVAFLVVVLYFSPFLVAGVGGGVVWLVNRGLEWADADRDGTIRAGTEGALGAAIQILVIAAVIVGYWVPRHLELTVEGGPPVESLGDGLGVSFYLIPGALGAVLLAVAFLSWGYVPDLWHATLGLGSLVVVVPTLIHQRVDRRRTSRRSRR